MCQNKECERRMECYRYRAKPSMHQSYMDFSEEDYNCFIKVSRGQHLVSVEELEERE